MWKLSSLFAKEYLIPSLFLFWYTLDPIFKVIKTWQFTINDVVCLFFQKQIDHFVWTLLHDKIIHPIVLHFFPKPNIHRIKRYRSLDLRCIDQHNFFIIRCILTLLYTIVVLNLIILQHLHTVSDGCLAKLFFQLFPLLQYHAMPTSSQLATYWPCLMARPIYYSQDLALDLDSSLDSTSTTTPILIRKSNPNNMS